MSSPTDATVASPTTASAAPTSAPQSPRDAHHGSSDTPATEPTRFSHDSQAQSLQQQAQQDELEDQRTPEERTAEARSAFLASLSNVGSNAAAPLEARAADISANAKALDAQEAALRKQTAALAKTTDEFQKMADDARGKLKEIGDVQNWAEMLERDLLVLEETMRIVEEEDEAGDLVEGTEALDLGFGMREGKGKEKQKKGWWQR